MALVHIVLVNWNGWRDTVECLESLLRVRGGDFCITVCDNGSTDGSIDKIEAYLAGALELPTPSSAVWSRLAGARQGQPGWVRVGADGLGAGGSALITIVDGGENRGFAGGNNIGVRRALADPECEFVWLLNNDTVVTAGALDALLQAMATRAELTICGSTLLFYHQPEIVQGVGGWYNLAIARGGHLGHLAAAGALPARDAVEEQLAYVMGASMFVRRAVFERTNGLSEDYFLYCEELDLARQLLPAERQGWAPDSVVYHKEGGSIGTSSIARPSDTSLYYLQLNTLRFYRKFHPLLLPIAFLRLARDAMNAALRQDYAALGITRLAVGDYLMGRRRTGAIVPAAQV